MSRIFRIASPRKFFDITFEYNSKNKHLKLFHEGVPINWKDHQWPIHMKLIRSRILFSLIT
jgi:hypothetical protein